MADNAYQYSTDDIYCYPGTKILQNKLGIQDAALLHETERNITYLKLLQLQKTPIRGQYGFSHLLAIHRFLFLDIYEWAGEIREGQFLSKGESIFCIGEHIPEYADNIFYKLEQDNKLRCMNKSVFISKLAYYMSELNALHPFREGNRRTAREFFRELSLSAGYILDYSGINANELLNADVAAYNRDYEPLKIILADALSKRQRYREPKR